MKVLYIDPVSGAAGDMFLGALVDAGAGFEELSAALDTLGLKGFTLKREKRSAGAFSATKITVLLEEKDYAYRHLSDILAIINNSSIPERSKGRAESVFRALAGAEAKVHGSTIEDVHFHETGAVDALVDITGTAVALELLGIEKIFSGPLRFGTGTVECEHGVIPVPSPAALELAKGFPAVFTGIEAELTTPTGAAVITALAEHGSMPGRMVVESSGYGAGTREGRDMPNVLRVVVGSAPDNDVPTECVIELVTTIDDCPAEILGSVMENLLDAGALDVYAAPVTMKKSRPGVALTVIAGEAERDALEQIIFRETTTFGIRRRRVERSVLERETVEVETAYGPLKVKVGRLSGDAVSVQPEYESARALALEAGVALKEIYRAAMATGITPGEGVQR